MPRDKSPEQMRILAAEIAQRVYLLHEPQSKVGQDLNLHKSTVSRLLSLAKEEGLFTVHMHLPRVDDLETRLNRHYKIDAVVVPVVPSTGGNGKETFTRVLAESAARFLEGPGSPLKSGQTVGISCGATIRDLVFSLTSPRFTRMNLIQLTVETEIEGQIDQSPFTLVSVLRAKWNDKETKAFAVQPLPGTLFLDANQPTKEYAPFRSRIIETAESLDVTIVGIGSATGGSFGQILKKPDIDESLVRRLRIVGEIVNHPYDHNGRDLFNDIKNLNRYVDGIEIDLLRRLVSSGKKVVAVAGGPSKVDAIRVALETRLVNILITDIVTAEALCAAKEPQPSPVGC